MNWYFENIFTALGIVWWILFFLRWMLNDLADSNTGWNLKDSFITSRRNKHYILLFIFYWENEENQALLKWTNRVHIVFILLTIFQFISYCYKVYLTMPR